MTRRIGTLAGTALLLTSCSALEGPDWLVAEARSPDGARVARLWCEDFCDVASASGLTLSAASRPIQLERHHLDGFSEGQMPDDDVALRVFRYENSPWLTLDWRDASTLVITGHCLTDGNFNPLPAALFRQVQIRFQDQAQPGQCEPRRG